MKINRFKGADMRETMSLVRAALGPDAVILESNRDDEGVEIAAAVDFSPVEYRRIKNAELASAKAAAATSAAADGADHAARPANRPEIQRLESEVENIRCLLEEQLSRLVWNENSRRNPQHASLMRHFANLGIAPDIATRLLRENPAPDPDGSSWTAALNCLANTLLTSEEDIVCRGGRFALVGPTGVGKTTTIAKLAARYAMHNDRNEIAFVTTDNFRIAAREQLETFGNILGVPVYAAADSDSLGAVLRGLEDKRLVLIDTAGMGQKDVRIAQQLGCLSHADADIEVLLTLPANAQRESLQEIVNSFQIVSPTACVLTKIDEATSLGGALSTMIRSELPAAYVTNGQRVPEDLHFAHPRRAWLIKSAVEMLNRREHAVTDDFLAQHFGEAIANECA